MHRSHHASLAALVLAFAAACAPSEDTDTVAQVPFPAQAGIQQGLSITSLERGGWNVCYEDVYSVEGVPVSGILAGCTGQYLMLACRFGTSGDLLQLAAADRKDVVTLPDAASATAHHVSANVGWYYDDAFSWGFFPATASVNRAPCDDTASGQTEQRLCWHTSGGDLAAGYRCGSTTALAGSSTWQRLILSHP